MGGRRSNGGAVSDTKTVEMFVVRARRIMAHSIFSDRELFNKLFAGSVTVKVTHNTKTGESSYLVVQELPAEEALESLAARIRPLLLAKEPVYFEKVLKALERLVPAEKLEGRCEPPSWWEAQWKAVYAPDGEAMGYRMITERGEVTDRKLMDRWVYGDLVHNDDIEEDTLGLSYEHRLRAAAGIVVRIAELIERMLAMVEALVEDGLLTLDPDVFTRQVAVTTTVLEMPAEVRVGEAETAAPTSLEELDPAVWRPMAQVIRPAELDDHAPAESLPAPEPS